MTPRTTEVTFQSVGKDDDTSRWNRHADLRQAVQALLQEHRDTLSTLHGALVNTPDAEQIHDARVATRRLRAVLSLCPLRPRAASRAARAQTRALGHALGAVRDRDVDLLWLDAHLQGDAAPAERPGLLRLRGLLQEQRALLLSDLKDTARRFFAGPNPADTLRAPRDRRLWGRLVRRTLRRRRRAVCDLIEQTLAAPTPELLHRLRIASKRLRYHLEPLRRASPRARALIPALRQVQDRLGAVHEWDVRLHWLPRRITAAAAPEWPGLVQLLRQAQAERDRRWAETPAALQALALLL